MASSKQTQQHADPSTVMEARYSLPYNWLHPRHARFWRGKFGLSRIVLNELGDISTKTVLDAGCGDGWYTDRIARTARKTIGLDFSERSIGFAKLIVPNADFIVGSITAIPLPDRSVDAITSIQVIEHLPPTEVASAVAEFARVLRDEGTLVISVPSRNRPMSPAHFQHFTEESLNDAVGTHFRIVRSLGQENRTIMLWILEKLSANRYWHLPRIGERLSKQWYPRYWNMTEPVKGQNLVIVCRKK